MKELSKERTNERVNTEVTDKFEVVPLKDMKLYLRTAFFWDVINPVVVIP
jgi:hypothetical protein